MTPQIGKSSINETSCFIVMISLVENRAFLSGKKNIKIDSLFPPDFSMNNQSQAFTIFQVNMNKQSSKPVGVSNDKEVLRKVSHSAIERKRRERINDRILILRRMVPKCSEHANIHKLTVLEYTIEYIRYLEEKLSLGMNNEGGCESYPSPCPTSTRTHSLDSELDALMLLSEQAYTRSPCKTMSIKNLISQ